jgi:hypothetical protein
MNLASEYEFANVTEDVAVEGRSEADGNDLEAVVLGYESSLHDGTPGSQIRRVSSIYDASIDFLRLASVHVWPGQREKM